MTHLTYYKYKWRCLYIISTASLLSLTITIYADALTGYVFGKMVFNDYESDMYITTDSTVC
jgi:hypothetical protein